MTQIHEQIKEIEDEVRKLVSMAMAINPEGLGYKPQIAIRSFANGCRDLQGFHLGELKNAFDIGDGKKLTEMVKHA
jgi:hypothetical protein